MLKLFAAMTWRVVGFLLGCGLFVGLVVLGWQVLGWMR